MRRGVFLAFLATWALVLVRLDSPADPPPDTSSISARPQLASETIGSSWYCPAGGINTDETVSHDIIISNIGPDPVEARLVGLAEETESSASMVVEVEANSVRVVSAADVGEDLGGFVVEMLTGSGVVEHRLRSATHFDIDTCVTGASTEWHFPIADTRLGASSGLWVMNPFPTDSSIDVTVSVADGVRVPTSLSGVVIPALSSRFIEMGDSIQRRAQFSFSVETRAGRVVAELVQSSDDSLVDKEEEKKVRDGMSMYMGLASTATDWVFADSFGGEASSEQIVVFNPTDQDTTVEVSVVPATDEGVGLPEPFSLDLISRRFAVIKLNEESRVPPGGIRSLRVRSFDGVGVVSAKSSLITGEGGDKTAATRPSVSKGVSIDTGSDVAAESWAVAMVPGAKDSESVVSVANPSTEKTATVDVAVLTGGERVDAGTGLKVPPGGSLSVDLAAALPTRAGSVLIDADGPVVVAARSTSTAATEIAMYGGATIGDWTLCADVP